MPRAIPPEFAPVPVPSPLVALWLAAPADGDGPLQVISWPVVTMYRAADGRTLVGYGRNAAAPQVEPHAYETPRGVADCIDRSIHPTVAAWVTHRATRAVLPAAPQGAQLEH